jgi:hypothetical protein
VKILPLNLRTVKFALISLLPRTYSLSYPTIRVVLNCGQTDMLACLQYELKLPNVESTHVHSWNKMVVMIKNLLTTATVRIIIV